MMAYAPRRKMNGIPAAWCVSAVRISMACFLIFNLTLFPSQAQARIQSPTFQEAMRLRAEGRLEEAERYLLRALEESPRDPDYHFELANLYAAHYDEWQDQPGHPEAQYFLKNAAHEFEQAVMLRPDFIPALFNLGVIYKKQSRFELAREKFRQVLENDPQSVQAWMQIGSTYEEQGFFDEARDAYLNAREIDFYNPDIAAAMDDLKAREAEFRQRQPFDTEGMGFLKRNFEHSPFSHAQSYEQQRQDAIQGTNPGGPNQAMPYLAAMLLQQLMSRRTASADNGT